jgi:hypothetical protein
MTKQNIMDLCLNPLLNLSVKYAVNCSWQKARGLAGELKLSKFY